MTTLALIFLLLANMVFAGVAAARGETLYTIAHLFIIFILAAGIIYDGTRGNGD